jgi:sugar/nucleoside kinase (ribokinase family)
MRDQIAEAGIADELAVLPGQATGLTVALQSAQRDRTFLTYLGVNRDWGPEMIPADALECGSLLLCDYFVAPRMQGDAARGLLSAARAAGARTYFDTAYDPQGFPPATRAEVRGLLDLVDVFLPNEDEARALTGADPAGGLEATRAAARELQRDGGGWIVVKLGARGCLAVGPRGEDLRVQAPVVDAADTTGAGDAFNAGLIDALSDCIAWPEALQAATRLASELIARPSHARHRPRDLHREAAG